MPKYNEQLHNLFITTNLTPKAMFDAVADLLNKGADPRAVVTDLDGVKSIAFRTALTYDMEDIVGLMLEASAKSGHPMDLSEPYPLEANDNNHIPMNWIHDASLCTTSACLEKMQQHQDKYHAAGLLECSFEEAINKKFYYKFPKKGLQLSTIGSVLLWTISVNGIRGNTQAANNVTFKELFEHWMYLFGDTAPSKTVAHNTTIILTSASDILNFLLRMGLNKHSMDHNGMTLITLAHTLEKAASDPESWERDVRPYIIWDGVKQSSKAALGNGGIYFCIRMCNLNGLHEVRCQATPQLKLLREEIEATEAPAKLTQLTQTVASHGRQLVNHEKRLNVVELKLNDLALRLERTAADQYNTALDNLNPHPFYQGVFKRLHKKTESLVRQLGDAKLNVFTRTPSSETRVAYSVLSLFNFTLQVCPVTPFASIIPLIGGMLVGYRSELLNARQSNAVFDATLDIKPETLATCVASLLVAQAMLKHSEEPSEQVMASLERDLFAAVESQIKKLSKQTFHDPEDVICFLCKDAVAKLQVQKVANMQPASRVIKFSAPVIKDDAEDLKTRHAPTTSSSSHSTPPRNFTATMQIDKATKKKASGGKCVMM